MAIKRSPGCVCCGCPIVELRPPCFGYGSYGGSYGYCQSCGTGEGDEADQRCWTGWTDAPIDGIDLVPPSIKAYIAVTGYDEGSIVTFEVESADDAVGAVWSDGSNTVSLIEEGGIKKFLLNSLQCEVWPNWDPALPFKIILHRNIHETYSDFNAIFDQRSVDANYFAESCNRYEGEFKPLVVSVTGGESVGVTMGRIRISGSDTLDPDCPARDCPDFDFCPDETGPPRIITGMTIEISGFVDCTLEIVNVNHYGCYDEINDVYSAQQIRYEFERVVQNTQLNGTWHGVLIDQFDSDRQLTLTEQNTLVNGIANGTICPALTNQYRWKFTRVFWGLIDYTVSESEYDMGTSCGNGCSVALMTPTSGTATHAPASADFAKGIAFDGTYGAFDDNADTFERPFLACAEELGGTNHFKIAAATATSSSSSSPANITGCPGLTNTSDTAVYSPIQYITLTITVDSQVL